MRDILPIAHFELIQLSNWRSEKPLLSAYDICDKVAPLRDQLGELSLDLASLLNPKFILDINSKLASALDDCEPPEFQNTDEWQTFINELTIEFGIAENPFSESGAYIFSQLFSKHLTTLRLLTSWLIVDALAQALSQPKLTISQTGLARIIHQTPGISFRRTGSAGLTAEF